MGREGITGIYQGPIYFSVRSYTNYGLKSLWIFHLSFIYSLYILIYIFVTPNDFSYAVSLIEALVLFTLLVNKDMIQEKEKQ